MDKLPELEFDLIMSRWCLHHVKIENRWHDLAKLGKLLKSDGIAVFIEQGYINNRSKIDADGLCYNLLAGVVDVVANAIYCPDWFLNNERTEDFILEFLDDMDLSILSSFVGGGSSGSLTVESLDGDGFIESILIFDKQGKS